MPDGSPYSNLEFEVFVQGDARVVVMVGEVDIASVGPVKGAVEELLAEGVLDLVYDLGRVEAIDSTGLGFLVWSRKRLREQSGRLRLVVNRSQVRRVLRLTGLARLFEVYSSLAAALAEENPPPEDLRPDSYGPRSGR